MKHLIIFDLDGVITSEESYWDCAGLTLHELLYSPRYWHVSTSSSYRPAANAQEFREFSRAALPEWLLLSFKARALNSNWDTGYAAICLDLIDLLSYLPDLASLLPLQPGDAEWTARLRVQIVAANLAQRWDGTRLHESWHERYPFDHPAFSGAVGLELFERLDTYASALLGQPVEGIFGRSRPFWRFCQQIFQEWLLGDTLFAQSYGHDPAQSDKPGCLFFEEPLLPGEQIRATLEALRARGYTLGIASGRVFQEAEKPLEQGGLLAYFDVQHMGTYDMVTRAEKIVRSQGITTMLGKPHPFHFQAAADWETALRNAYAPNSGTPSTPFIAVGDSTSDILSASAAGALTVAVLTGARTSEAREMLLKSRPDFVIEDVTRLPALLAEIESLGTIQRLQFERREIAEKLLRLWFARQMDLHTEQVRLTPRAVSLNSFNGFYTSQGQEYFFKTHVEEHGVLNEYYHAELLSEAGYHVVRPLQLLREKDRQMVIYPVVTDPVMFDLMRAAETGQELPEGISAETLLEAERAECAHLLEIYARTLQPAQNTSSAPVHQLFWQRLQKRFTEFYADKSFPLPGGAISIPFERLMRSRWTINGLEYPASLAELVEQGKQVLDPARATASVVGHGDAHFGNVFLSSSHLSYEEKDTGADCEETAERQSGYAYRYFDPAFAGRHAPLLDIVKPLFHNIFATWMYFPREVARDLQVTVRLEGAQIIVDHNAHLTALRSNMLRVKREKLLIPLVALLHRREALPENWRDALRLALMCCPLLTVDLFDETKRPPEIGWLGLSQALQFGNAGLPAWKEGEE